MNIIKPDFSKTIIEGNRPAGNKKTSEEVMDKVVKGSEEKEPFLLGMEKLRSVSEGKSHESGFSVGSFINSYDKKLGIKEPFLTEKHDLMKTDPHVFYRATPALFYHDLKNDFSVKSKLLEGPAPEVIIDGDVHLRNFGTIKGPDKTVCWGLNDYDQAGKGSPEWDLERLAVSAVLTGKLAHLSKEDIGTIIEDMGKKYFHTIKKIASGDIEPHPAFLSKDESEGKIEDMIEKAEEKSQKDFIKKYVKFNKDLCEITGENIDKLKDEITDKGKLKVIESLKDQIISTDDLTGQLEDLSFDKKEIEAVLEEVSGDREIPVFKHSEDIVPLAPEMKKKIKSALVEYDENTGDTPRLKRPLHIYDVAEKLRSGGSSYGLPRYYALAEHSDPDKEPLIIEIKLLFGSGIKDETGDLALGDAKTVAESQKAMQQKQGNPITGYTQIDGCSYLVREYEREKQNTPLEDFTDTDDLNVLGKQAAQVIAFGHGRTKMDAEKIESWVKDDEEKAIERLKEFAFSYADKVEGDYRDFKKEG